MSGLWRNRKDTPEGKYLVQRRDGTVPEWPYFVLGAKDPAAPIALREYANAAEVLGYDGEYVSDIRRMADDWDEYRSQHGAGDPDAEPHRTDDPAVVEKMRIGGSA